MAVQPPEVAEMATSHCQWQFRTICQVAAPSCQNCYWRAYHFAMHCNTLF